MRFLLDTHLLIWATYHDQAHRLPSEAARLITARSNTVFFSAVSIAEVAIKTALGRASFRFDPGVLRRSLIDNDYAELPLSSDHALEIARLPPIHRDPFDRLLVAQASAEGLTLLTADAQIALYPGSILKV